MTIFLPNQAVSSESTVFGHRWLFSLFGCVRDTQELIKKKSQLNQQHLCSSLHYRAPHLYNMGLCHIPFITLLLVGRVQPLSPGSTHLECLLCFPTSTQIRPSRLGPSVSATELLEVILVLMKHTSFNSQPHFTSLFILLLVHVHQPIFPGKWQATSLLCPPWCLAWC